MFVFLVGNLNYLKLFLDKTVQNIFYQFEKVVSGTWLQIITI